MRVFKNLFGDNSKIHADEIIVGDKLNNSTLTETLKGLNDYQILWQGYANSGEIELSKPVLDFAGLVIRTNSNPETSFNRGTLFTPSVALLVVSYYPAMYGSNLTYVRIESVGEKRLKIGQIGNPNLYITTIFGVGSKHID